MITYELVGDSTASQYFDVHPSTGGIYVKRDLRTTSIDQFRIEVRAVDGGGRYSIANSFRVINVRRNDFAPRFADGSCDLTVSATGVGTVVRVDASDADIGRLYIILCYIILWIYNNLAGSRQLHVGCSDQSVALYICR